MEYIHYNGKKVRRLMFSIEYGAEFNQILRNFSNISLPGCPCDEEHTRYALLELVNNSLRAHREHGVEEDIHVDMHVESPAFRVRISDKGRGFDVGRLPYDLSRPVEEIDLNSEKFQVYREENEYKRFGMGLLIARKIFSDFRLMFLDETGDEVSWESGRAVGTVIELGMGGAA